MEQLISQISILFPTLSVNLYAGILVFARVFGFMRFSPVFNRKEINAITKIAIAIIFTIILVTILHPSQPPETNSKMVLMILINFATGAMIGYMAQLILLAIDAGADMINMQMGLSSAMVMDPTTQSQTSILGRVISLFGLLIFIHIGGIYWLIKALINSYTIFPLYAVKIPLEQLVNLDYLINMSSNVLYMGLQIASPVLLATLCQDIILGVISKTAPQVNVFQLSFLFKPVLGAMIMVWILPMLMDILHNYYTSYSHIL